MSTPSLLDALRLAPVASRYLKTACEENAVRVTLASALDPTRVVILAPDRYYNAEHWPTPPPSPDCLVVVQCADGAYSVYIVELKNIGSPRGFKVKNVQAKFATCLNDFMQNVLGQHFNDTTHVLRQIKLYFVTAPYGPEASAHDRLAHTPKLDVLLTAPPFRYKNLFLSIEHYVPHPAIGPC